MRRRLWIVPVVAPFALFLLAGCDSGGGVVGHQTDPDAGLPRGNVSGKVTVNGQPPSGVSGVKILFQPKEGRYEALDVKESGEYSGVVKAGENKVFFSATSAGHGGTPSPILDKYMSAQTTTHTANVKEGTDNAFDFEVGK